MGASYDRLPNEKDVEQICGPRKFLRSGRNPSMLAWKPEKTDINDPVR